MWACAHYVPSQAYRHLVLWDPSAAPAVSSRMTNSPDQLCGVGQRSALIWDRQTGCCRSSAQPLSSSCIPPEAPTSLGGKHTIVIKKPEVWNQIKFPNSHPMLTACCVIWASIFSSVTQEGCPKGHVRNAIFVKSIQEMLGVQSFVASWRCLTADVTWWVQMSGI